MLGTNILALLVGCQAAVKAMRACKAERQIVNISSIAAQPGVTAPIAGPRTLEQVTDNLASTEIRLDRDGFDQIDALVPPCSAAVNYDDRAMGLDLRAHRGRNLT